MRKPEKSVLDSVVQIPISVTSTMRRVETLALEVFEMLLHKLRKAEVMSLAVDESTDNSDSAQSTPPRQDLHCPNKIYASPAKPTLP